MFSGPADKCWLGPPTKLAGRLLVPLALPRIASYRCSLGHPAEPWGVPFSVMHAGQILTEGTSRLAAFARHLEFPQSSLSFIRVPGPTTSLDAKLPRGAEPC